MSMNGDILEYKEIYHENCGAMSDGRLQLLNEKIIFKNNKTGKVDTIANKEMVSSKWRRVARGFELKLSMINGHNFKFDGFKESDYDRIQNFIKNKYGIEVEPQELSGRGWNWGKTEFHGNELQFEVGNKLSFEVPLSNVSQCAPARDEVTLEFHQNDDSELSLMEMRFYIPPSQDDNVDNVKDFYDSVMAKADVLQVKGNAICTFQDVQCLTPRGRYDIRMYPKFIQLHGKTFDYKITYTAVLRLFLLPHKDQRQIFFVVSLDPPLRQGQTRYHFLILLFFQEDELSVEFSLTEDEMEERFSGKLQKHMSGPMYDVVSKVMKHLVQRKITVPGSFKGFNGTQSVTCAYKASSGFLFPLERGFMYVHKPPVHIRFDEIAFVNFARGKANINRFFDFEIETRSKNSYTFSNIEREQYTTLYDYVSSKKLKIKNIGKDGVNYDTMMGSDDEEPDTHDPYLARMKQEAADRDGGDDDDSESEDEDFKPDEKTEEVAEEYDSDADSDDNDESGSEEGSESSEEEKPKKKKQQHAPVKRAKKEKPVSTKQGSRKRKQKDPNAPKRPSSGYMLWLNDNRSRIKNQNPGISITELSKKAGVEWKEVSSSTKEKYEKKYLSAKVSYIAAMEEYKRSGGGSSTSRSPVKKTKKTKSSGTGVSPSKFKSKEFITESDSLSSSDSEPEAKPKPKPPKKKEASSESEEEEAAEETPESSEEESEEESD